MNISEHHRTQWNSNSKFWTGLLCHTIYVIMMWYVVYILAFAVPIICLCGAPTQSTCKWSSDSTQDPPSKEFQPVIKKRRGSNEWSEQKICKRDIGMWYHQSKLIRYEFKRQNIQSVNSSETDIFSHGRRQVTWNRTNNKWEENKNTSKEGQ
jgi:hypothetical protein